MDIPSVYYYIF